jgi:hypothetical protein
MIKKIYETMTREEKKDYSRLLAAEINTNLKKIYKTMKRKARLKPQKISPSQIIMKHASLGATKMWEFKVNSCSEVAKGNIGNVVVVTRGLRDDHVRKQRALFIAAEFYVYHAAANHPTTKYFDSVRCQNQYWDLTKKLLGIKNAHEKRDQAIRYIIEEIKEHKLAHSRGRGWFVSIAKLKKHYPDIAEVIGSSEKTFTEIFRKQHQVFTPAMLKQEEDLIRKEIEDLEYLIDLLEIHAKMKYTAHMNKLVKIHIANLKTFKKALEGVRKNLDNWVLVDKEEHGKLRNELDIPTSKMRELLLAEAEAEKIDINKVHIVLDYFKKEKINILRDLEMLDRMSASRHKK